MSTALTNDCRRLLDFGIDPVNLITWAQSNQLRVVIDAALPRTLQATRVSLFNGATYIEQVGEDFIEKPHAKPEHIVPPDPVYYAPLIR